MKSSILLLALPLVTLILPGCIEFSDQSAEKHYLKKGATPKEASQKAFEQEVFSKADSWKAESQQGQDPSSRARRKEVDDAWNGR